MSKNLSGGGRSTRTVYFDVLNIFACFGVVCMHFNSLTHAYSPTPAWHEALFVDCIFYWAVPIFFMLTGANLMRYRERYSTKEFFRKRFMRTLVPFLAWSFILLAWKVTTGQMEAPEGKRALINMVFNAQIEPIYWFFIPLFAVYLCMPLLSHLADERKTLAYGAIVAIVLNIICPNLAPLVGVTWNVDMTMSLLSGYLIYAALGYLLKDWDPPFFLRALIYLLGLVGTFVRYFGTAVSSDAAGQMVHYMWGYTNIPCFVESIAVFVLIKNISWDSLFKSERSKRALAKISGCSFGIYLTHLIAFYYGVKITGMYGDRLEWRTLGPVIAYLVCLTITYVGKRIPGIKLLFP